MKYVLNAFFVLLLAGCAKTDSKSPVMAQAGKNTLTLAAAENILNPSAIESDLETIINRWLDDEVLYMAAMQVNFHKDTKIKSALEAYKKRLLGRAYLNYYVQKRIQIKTDELEVYYKNNINSFNRRFDQALILHFLVQNKNEAQNIRAELKKNGTKQSNHELMDRYSVLPQEVMRNNLIPELNRIIFENKKNSLPPPVKSKAGYHVVQILNRRPAGSPKELVEVYDEVQQRLVRKKSILITQALLDSLKHAYNAKSFLEKNQ